MGIRTWLGFTPAQPTAAASESRELAAALNQLDLVRESMADLELALEDQGWQRMLAESTEEFSRDGLNRAARLARIVAVQNPLARRGVAVRTSYVWGQGVSIAARATGANGDQDVNTVIQGFLDDPLNRRAFTGAQARERHEKSLATDGNVFLSLPTSPLTGRVNVRVIPFTEVTQIIANPDDKEDVWFYRRVWNGEHGTRDELYPDLLHSPRARPVNVDGLRVNWDKPVVHVHVNKQEDWQFGIGDLYPALSWARAYKDFLGDWVTLVKALSRFAWKATAPASKAQQLRAEIAREPGLGSTGAPLAAGATFTAATGVTLEAIPKTGATIDSESGKPVAAMVAAALDIPVTMILGDPGQTGARAVAETLDKPTELAMGQRRTVWADAHQRIFTHVIESAALAPRGPLTPGPVTLDRETGRRTVTLAADTDPTVDITWPDLSTAPVTDLVKAITDADSTQRLPGDVVARLLLQALGVDDVDDIVDTLIDADGNFIPPDTPPADPYRQTPDTGSE